VLITHLQLTTYRSHWRSLILRGQFHRSNPLTAGAVHPIPDRVHGTGKYVGTEDDCGGAWNFDVPGQGYTAYSTETSGWSGVVRRTRIVV
jgi:hypothetical protein